MCYIVIFWYFKFSNFTTRKRNCSTVNLYYRSLPSVNEVKYLGMYLNRRLTWTKHFQTKSKSMDLKLCKMLLTCWNFKWLVGRKSQLSLYNKLIICKVIIKPVWTYGIQLWGATCNSNQNINSKIPVKDTETDAWRPLVRDKYGNPQRPWDRNGKERNQSLQQTLRQTP